MNSFEIQNFNEFNRSLSAKLAVSPMLLSSDIDSDSEHMPVTLIDLHTLHHLVFCVFFAFFLVVGICFNLIVVLTYKFYDNKSVYHNNSINYNNKIISVRHNLNEEALIRQSISSKGADKNVNVRCPYVYGKTTPVNGEVSNFKRMPSLNESIHVSHAQSLNDSNRFLFKFKSKKSLDTQNAQQFNVSITHANTMQANSLLTLGAYGAYSSGYNRIKRCSYFILSLSCCDLVICSVNMPLNFMVQSGYFDVVLRGVFIQSFYSNLWCKLTYFIMEMPVVLEIELLLMIAIDRYAR